MTSFPQLIARVDVSSLGPAPQAFRIDASADDRRQLADALKILKINTLQADLRVTREDEMVLVSGVVRANMEQQCVVSFAPVPQDIEESIDLRFVDGPGADVVPRPGAEVRLESVEDVPEPLVDGLLDLSALVIEHFALGIDPYPRAPGAEVPKEYVKGKPAADESPFSVLAKLVDR